MPNMGFNILTFSSLKKPPVEFKYAEFKDYYHIIILAASLVFAYMFCKQIMAGLHKFFNKTKRIKQGFYIIFIIESKEECDDIINNHFSDCILILL
ncbi:hypothetical protein WDU94_010891 [Cyamophila willieti]